MPRGLSSEWAGATSGRILVVLLDPFARVKSSTNKIIFTFDLADRIALRGCRVSRHYRGES